jgi:hypothetical protein
MSHETLRELDGLVREIRGDVSIYSLVTPENDSEQREFFLAGKVEEPRFTYSGEVENSGEIRRELEELDAELEELSVEESVQRLYEDSIREGEALLDISEMLETQEWFSRLHVRSTVSRQEVRSTGRRTYFHRILSKKAVLKQSTEAMRWLTPLSEPWTS